MKQIFDLGREKRNGNLFNYDLLFECYSVGNYLPVDEAHSVALSIHDRRETQAVCSQKNDLHQSFKI